VRHRRGPAQLREGTRSGLRRRPAGLPLPLSARYARKLPGLRKPVFFGPWCVDRKEAESYIERTRCAVRLGVMARLRSTSLIFGDQASDIPSEAKGFDGSPACPGGGTTVPGCLTSESGERETWTAESLRAASRVRGKPFIGGGRTRLRRSHVSGQHDGPTRTRVGPRQWRCALARPGASPRKQTL
jgi:hypothetical protein